MSRHILGLSAYYHDSAAALLRDGRVVAAAQQERFSRIRHDAAFPADAIASCLERGGIGLGELESIVFYDKPLLKFERLLETYVSYAPRGFRSFATAMPVWLKDKLYLRQTLMRELAAVGRLPQRGLPRLLFCEHHRSHAASAFFMSPYRHAAVLCLDGVGEWATTTAWRGAGNALEPLWQIDFPHSLGLLYSAFTYFTGFRVNSGEYKLMGLAPYGEPRYVDLILDRIVDLRDDGTFRLDMTCFDYCTGLTMTSPRFDALFEGPPRRAEGPITEREMDLAASIQAVTEEIVLRLSRTLHVETGERALCLAGGVALNCVANGRVLREGPFDDVWVQPAAGDAGAALGAAAAIWHEYEGQERLDSGDEPDAMGGAYLGPSYGQDEIEARLGRLSASFERLEESALFERVAALIADGNAIGWFQGRMEFGPRALGARSILADPRDPDMQSRLNRRIKFRESFRPFAPAVLAHRVADWFDHARSSPYMAFTAFVRADRRLDLPAPQRALTGLDRIGVARSRLPAVTHVDDSARLQTVHAETNPRFFALLEAFEALTGCPVLINTSFNVRGEPIVCTPEDAYRCFMRTGLDYLVIGNCLLAKSAQRESAGIVNDDDDPQRYRETRGIEAGQTDDFEPDARQRDARQRDARQPDARHTVVVEPGEVRRLRQFGIVLGLGVPVVLGLLLPLLAGRPLPVWPWVPGIALLLWSAIHPGSLAPLERAWMGFGRIMGRVTTPIVLGAVFVLAVVPTAWIRRGLGRDSLRRRLDPAAVSYRVASQQRARHDVEKPY